MKIQTDFISKKEKEMCGSFPELLGVNLTLNMGSLLDNISFSQKEEEFFKKAIDWLNLNYLQCLLPVIVELAKDKKEEKFVSLFGLLSDKLIRSYVGEKKVTRAKIKFFEGVIDGFYFNVNKFFKRKLKKLLKKIKK
jgi:uncharacterized membrane-anchored protein YjiN (DUF445 family)